MQEAEARSCAATVLAATRPAERRSVFRLSDLSPVAREWLSQRGAGPGAAAGPGTASQGGGVGAEPSQEGGQLAPCAQASAPAVVLAYEPSDEACGDKRRSQGGRAVLSLVVDCRPGGGAGAVVGGS